LGVNTLQHGSGARLSKS